VQVDITPEAYLAAELATQIKHEFVDGVVYAMGGASARHGTISLTLAARLLDDLPERYEVFNAEMKLRIKRNQSVKFYYPDVLVSCAGTDQSRYYREQPIFLCEVLSRTTERVDRHEKFPTYIKIDSLQEFLIASQDFVGVELYRRSSDWKPEVFKAGETFTLASVDLAVIVDDLYRRVRFLRKVSP
jgi:Uma2 family endonuclease